MGRIQAEEFVAGYLGGAASVIVGHPLDTVKARLQVGKGYGNTFNCIFTIYKNENVAGFFKGMSFPLASIAVYNSVVFGVFSNTLSLLSQYRDKSPRQSPDLFDLTVASMLSGCISVGIGGPVDLVKIRLQMQTQEIITGRRSLNQTQVPHKWHAVYNGPAHCMSCILRQEGIAGMYRGAGAMLLRDIPGYCLYFIPYTFLCEWITSDQHRAPSSFCVWIAGGLAGALSWGTATPMDVVKSRLQADGVHSTNYKGVTDCITQSYQKEGIRVFFKGITVNTVRGFPMSAAMFLTYELTRKAMKRTNME
ncbi:hypothetical protein XENTR_v10008014 [Xenopus tropicalis]|uniref:Solute carrier family 25 member 48 n=1 Tax=Xenopus tropicalis TaxID=8364 RepID=F6VT64_XENTR|nr:solute carrier family 25 member 48 isoform X2 [Xenopus tropicalis]KAE8614148.1 hypothetical protein XENTR_v10008014 [Xenopus tropicalis]|eukprot:XP_012814589.1 PREDICTED: solute carrier family 25 member 48 isoform X1 [Xenopus tropicalis]